MMADVEKVIQGMKCCENYIYRDHDNCPYQSTCYHDGVSKALISDALSVIRELQAENKQLKDKRINAAKRIEKLIEQHRHSRNANTMGMVGGLRIALEIIGDEPKEGE